MGKIVKSIKSWSMQHWMIWKALLNGNLLNLLHFTTASCWHTQHWFWGFKKQRL